MDHLQLFVNIAKILRLSLSEEQNLSSSLWWWLLTLARLLLLLLLLSSSLRFTSPGQRRASSPTRGHHLLWAAPRLSSWSAAQTPVRERGVWGWMFGPNMSDMTVWVAATLSPSTSWKWLSAANSHFPPDDIYFSFAMKYLLTQHRDPSTAERDRATHQPYPR